MHQIKIGSRWVYTDGYGAYTAWEVVDATPIGPSIYSEDVDFLRYHAHIIWSTLNGCPTGQPGRINPLSASYCGAWYPLDE